MARSIKVTDEKALAVVRDMAKAEEDAEKFREEQTRKVQKAFNDYMTKFHKQYREDLDRFRFAAGITHSLDGWSIDKNYLEHGVIFIVQSSEAEKQEAAEAFAEKVKTGASEQ